MSTEDEHHKPATSEPDETASASAQANESPPPKRSELEELVAAGFADEEEGQTGLLQLPDALSDDDGAETEALSPEQLAAQLDADDSAGDWGTTALDADPEAVASESDAPTNPALAEAQDHQASWSADADSTPLLDEADGNEAQLREQINQRIHHLGDEEAEALAVPEVIDLPPREVRAAIEALLLVANRPLSVDRLCTCLPGAQASYMSGLLAGLAARYEAEHRGWELRQLAGGWQLLTRSTLHPWVRQLDKQELPSKLSKSAMETLAIVAYKQPATRGDIEDIRGVQCGPMLRQLMDMKLVQVVGRNDEAVGRPMLYGTTNHFLDRFGLGSTADLPRRHEFG